MYSPGSFYVLVFLTLIFNSLTNGGQVFPSSYGLHEEDDNSGPSDPEAAAARERCSFPPRWEGTWFQSGVHQTIVISRHSINIKGKCLEADGEKFIVFNQRDSCYRCVAFHEKHGNVLQYKETFCIPERRSLRSMCSTITGDANLFSMFRLDAPPIDCPFRGPFTFTYNRGHGDCRYPVSTIDSCLRPSHLRLNYQACPDVPGTESTVEQLECLATWKEGSSRYLLGLIRYTHPASLEDRFRCFVYEKVKKSIGHPNIGGIGIIGGHHHNSSDVMYRVAQSGDATCAGLTPMEGSRILTLKKATIPKNCLFPSWLQHSKPWHTLDGRSTFFFEGGDLRATNLTETGGLTTNSLTMTASCSQIQGNPSLDKVVLVLHMTADCQSGYVCTTIYKRDNHIIELQMGSLSRRMEDACQMAHFDPFKQPFTTLTSSFMETRQCPQVGRFEVTNILRSGRELTDKCTQAFNSLSVGCSALDMMQLYSGCSKPSVIGDYSCHGWWEEQGTRYLIASPNSRKSSSSSPKRFCFAFREDTSTTQDQRADKLRQSYEDPVIVGSAADTVEFGRSLQFSVLTDSCQRNIRLGSDGYLAFNVSSQGRCDVNSAKSTSASRVWLWTASVISIVVRMT